MVRSTTREFWREAMEEADPWGLEFEDSGLFDELSTLELEEGQDGEYAQGQRPPPASDETAARIFGLLFPGDPQGTRHNVAFGVGPEGVQANVTRKRELSKPDVSFRGHDGRRVNLEVDRGRLNHQADHLRAMREAQEAYTRARAGQRPRSRRDRPITVNPAATTRSVFTATDAQGRIREIRHVHYEVVNGRVRAVQDSRVRLRNPLTAAQAVQLGVLDDPRRARQVAQQQQAAASSRPQRRGQARPASRQQGGPARRVRASRGGRRGAPGSRFNAFLGEDSFLGEAPAVFTG